MSKSIQKHKNLSLFILSSIDLVGVKQLYSLILTSDKGKFSGVEKILNQKGYNFIFHEEFSIMMFTRSKCIVNISLKKWAEWLGRPR